MGVTCDESDMAALDRIGRERIHHAPCGAKSKIDNVNSKIIDSKTVLKGS